MRRGTASAVQPAMEREYVEVGADLHDGGQLVLGWQFVEPLTVVVEKFVDSIVGAGGDGAVRRQECGVGKTSNEFEGPEIGTQGIRFGCPFETDRRSDARQNMVTREQNSGVGVSEDDVPSVCPGVGDHLERPVAQWNHVTVIEPAVQSAVGDTGPSPASSFRAIRSSSFVAPHRVSNGR